MQLLPDGTMEGATPGEIKLLVAIPLEEEPDPVFGYHKTLVPKGELGDFSKIREEFLELEDAHEQGSPVLILCELSDLCGAIELYLKKHHPNITVEDIVKFSRQTQQAFQTGAR